MRYNECIMKHLLDQEKPAGVDDKSAYRRRAGLPAGQPAAVFNSGWMK